MEAELRDTLKDIRDSVKEATASVHAKLDSAATQFNAHLIEDARNFQRLETQTAALHDRMDEASKERQQAQANKWAMWVAIAAAVVVPLISLVVQLIRGGKL